MKEKERLTERENKSENVCLSSAPAGRPYWLLFSWTVCVCVFVCKGGCEQLSELVAVHVQSGCHSTLLRSYMLD